MSKTVVRKGRKVFELNINDKQENLDQKWRENFQILIDFIKEYGHQKYPLRKYTSNFAPKYRKISTWVIEQRTAYKEGRMFDWRYDMLIKAGFYFDPHEVRWNEKYNELIEYKKLYGHCNVSLSDPGYKTLARWSTKQRIFKKELSDLRTKKLNDIGFYWGVKLITWNDSYEILKSYYLKHGTTYVENDVNDNENFDNRKDINRWCVLQSSLYRQGKLSQEKYELLKDLNFDFDYRLTMRQKKWERNFQKLLDYKAEYGHCKVPYNWPDKVLSVWIRSLKKNKNKLKDDKIKRLNEIGFFEIQNPKLIADELSIAPGMTKAKII